MSRPALHQLRVALGFRLEEVAQRARWSPDRQRALEAGVEPSAEEAEVLSSVLGTPAERLWGGSVGSPPLGALLKSQATALDADTRFAITEAVGVARTIKELRGRLGRPTGLGRVGAFHANTDYGHPRDGIPERLASVARRDLALGNGPIRSMTEDVLAPLGIVVLWSPLDRSIDALAFASEDTGAVIVANPYGGHLQSAEGRRVTFAHELCHLLFDRPEMSRFVQACRIEGGPRGIEAAWFERVEQRARAFALAFLAPRPAMDAVWQDTPGEPGSRVAAVMATFGIGYSAARAHLHNQRVYGMEQPATIPVVASAGWNAVDPAPARPPDGRWLRHGELEALVTAALTARLVSRRWAEETLRGPLVEPQAWIPREGDGIGFQTTSMR